MTDEQVIPGDVSRGRRNGPSFILIIFLVVIGLAVIFFLQNGEKVAIDFLVVEKATTIRWSILMAVVLGILIDRAFSIWWHRRGNKKNK